MSRLFLVGDIGGTNTNLAFAESENAQIKIIKKARYATQQVTSLREPLQRFLQEAYAQGLNRSIDYCCISGAGPVQADESIQLTNAPWSLRTNNIAELINAPTKLINDFTALSYAITQLNHLDVHQVTHLAHSDGSKPEPHQGMMLVIGAGTGLGVGLVYRDKDRIEAFPSEGGHSELPCYDALSQAFFAWISARCGYPAGAELAVSGQGISNIFEFLCSSSFSIDLLSPDYEAASKIIGTNMTIDAREILACPRDEWPVRIASASCRDPFCFLTMEIFIRLYALKAANLTSIMLPTGGVWLAGGISTKNEPWFLENYRFMKWFEKNYAVHIRQFLSSTPVFIVKNYDISLMGAAVAALQFSMYR